MSRTLHYASPAVARPKRPISPLPEYVLVTICLLAMYGFLVLICYVGVFGG